MTLDCGNPDHSWVKLDPDGFVVLESSVPFHKVGTRLFEERPELKPLVAHHYQTALRDGSCRFYALLEKRLWRCQVDKQQDGSLVAAGALVDLQGTLREMRLIQDALELAARQAPKALQLVV